MRRDDEKRRQRYQRLIAAGSCQDCGAEATNGTTRCTPCGQRNSAHAKSRALILRAAARFVEGEPRTAHKLRHRAARIEAKAEVTS